MLRMPPFDLHRPATSDEAFRLATELPDAMYVAGGTDLLPNLKHGLHDAKHLIGLSHLSELVGISLLDDGTLRIGAGTSLHDVATSELVHNEAPAIAISTGMVAGPQHRRMGTIGGNVMLDTRCLFYNQSAPWRKALGFCLKREGDLCHVIDSKTACVAAHSSDSVPALMALDAQVELIAEGGRQTFSLRDAFTQDGRFERMLSFSRQSLLVAVLVPPRPAGHRSTYRKIRTRESVDFPQLGIAVAAGFDGDVVTGLDAVVSAVMPRPKVLKHMTKAVGTKLDDAMIEVLSDHAYKQTKPQDSLHGSAQWRREMARVEMRRALLELRGQ